MSVPNEVECLACPGGRRDLSGGPLGGSPANRKPVGQQKGHFLRRSVVWAGSRLVVWGRRLEERNCAHRLSHSGLPVAGAGPDGSSRGGAER